MALVVRHAGRFLRDQVVYWVRSGAWWIPASIVILAVAVLVAVTSQAVVPQAVYVLF